MGLFSFLFGNNKVQQPPQIQSIYPHGAVLQVQSGKLPTIQADKLVLKKGEVCHFVDRAVIMTEKRLKKSQHMGGSYHIFKGTTLHVGDTVSEPIYEPEYTQGIFYITNKRTVFVATQNGFDKKVDDITAITPYADGIDLQCGSKTYILFLPDGNLVNTILKLII